MAELLTYAKFYAEEQAAELVSFFHSKNIAFVLEKDREVLDKIYVGDTLDPLFNLKINSEDFQKANKLVVSEFPVDASQLDKDYYLFSFSSKELQEVVNTPSEWNYFDRALAGKLLLVKTDIPETPIKKNGDYIPEKISNTWLVAEYLLAIVFAYAGIIIGLATLAAYKNLGNGSKAKMYDAYTRKHSAIILFIGIVRTLYFNIKPLIYTFLTNEGG